MVDAFGVASTSQNMTGAGKRAAAAYALKELNDRFAPDSIVIDEVRIRAVYPDDATVTALRSRLAAQQSLKISQLNLQLQTITNQKAVLAATAQAQAAHIRAASLTPRLVKSRHIKDMEIVGVPRGTICQRSYGKRQLTVCRNSRKCFLCRSTVRNREKDSETYNFSCFVYRDSIGNASESHRFRQSQRLPIHDSQRMACRAAARAGYRTFRSGPPGRNTQRYSRDECRSARRMRPWKRCRMPSATAIIILTQTLNN